MYSSSVTVILRLKVDFQEMGLYCLVPYKGRIKVWFADTGIITKQ